MGAATALDAAGQQDRGENHLGEDPATKRKEARKVPTYDDFLTLYWKQAAAKWKPSTHKTHDYYRRRHLDHAFFGMFIDEIEQSTC